MRSESTLVIPANSRRREITTYGRQASYTAFCFPHGKANNDSLEGSLINRSTAGHAAVAFSEWQNCGRRERQAASQNFRDTIFAAKRRRTSIPAELLSLPRCAPRFSASNLWYGCTPYARSSLAQSKGCAGTSALSKPLKGGHARLLRRDPADGKMDLNCRERPSRGALGKDRVERFFHDGSCTGGPPYRPFGSGNPKSNSIEDLI
jgi:hypothetical protein